MNAAHDEGYSASEILLDSATVSHDMPDVMQLPLQSSHPGNDGDSGTTDAADKKTTGKGGWPKGRKRKKPKDENAPKQPLSGYLRFLNERRDKIRAENPGMSFSEISKLLGGEWSKMAQHEKQKYLDEAERDRERYQRELEAYQQTDTYKMFRHKVDKVYSGDDCFVGANENNTGEPQNQTDTMPAFDIPIFTEEFIAHNKSREGELRQLRKQNTELEENNAILSKHIDNMKTAIGKLEVESVQQRNTNLVLQQHLDNLRSTLVTHFSGIALPGSDSAVTADSIDTYMAKLHSLIIDAPQEHEALIAKIRDIVARLNFDDPTKMWKTKGTTLIHCVFFCNKGNLLSMIFWNVVKWVY